MTSKNSAPYLPANNMNQPTDPGITYDLNGNLKTHNGYVYNYDAQNRLRTVLNANNITVAQFWYDGLNRQVARSITAITIPNMPVTTSTFSVWDGDWAILEEYTTGNVLAQSYVQGAHGLVKTLPNNIYYYQDSLGSTSHVASAAGALMEYYKYDLYGKPTAWSPLNTQLSAINPNVRDLHGGQRWIPELGLYDDRNRFMSPDLGRFLQPDPIGFKGDASNLYRFVGNDWANRTDPMGLDGTNTYVLQASPMVQQNDPLTAQQRMDLQRVADGGSGIAAARAVQALDADSRARAEFNSRGSGARSDGNIIKQVAGGFKEITSGIESYVRGVGRGLDAAAGLAGLKGEQAQKVQQQAISDVYNAASRAVQETKKNPEAARRIVVEILVLKAEHQGMHMAGRYAAASAVNQIWVPAGKVPVPVGFGVSMLAFYGDLSHKAVAVRQSARQLHAEDLLDSVLTGGGR